MFWNKKYKTRTENKIFYKTRNVTFSMRESATSLRAMSTYAVKDLSLEADPPWENKIVDIN